MNKLDIKNKTIFLGSYPQTHVSDETLINTLNTLTIDNNISCVEYEGYQYTKVQSKPYEDRYIYSDHSKVNTQSEWFKVEKIEWIIMNIHNNEYTLISKYILDSSCFDRNNKDYEESNIRSYLIDYLLDIIYTKEEQELLIPNHVLFSDLMWIPSFNELKNGKMIFKTMSDLKTVPTDFCLSKGIYYEEETSSSPFWLRDKTKETSKVNYVFIYGDIKEARKQIDYIGIRPVIKIKIEEGKNE